MRVEAPTPLQQFGPIYDVPTLEVDRNSSVNFNLQSLFVFRIDLKFAVKKLVLFLSSIIFLIFLRVARDANLLVHPVVLMVILIPLLVEQVLQNLAEITNVGLVLKLEISTVVLVCSKFSWHAFAQRFYGNGQFFIADFLVLLLLGPSWDSLPGKIAPVEVHHHIADRLKVVSPGLLNTKMSIQ